MPWYQGQTILEHLEELEPADVWKGKRVSPKRYPTKNRRIPRF
jgi:sulfate adenylyltransferase subunit 1 (EFTu-like GTPase family)